MRDNELEISMNMKKSQDAKYWNTDRFTKEFLVKVTLLGLCFILYYRKCTHQQPLRHCE